MDSGIEGVEIQPLKKHDDSRGWLMELFRDDTLPEGFRPAMGYISATRPGVCRGPHEHAAQADGFVFLSGRMEVALWENRPGRDRKEFRLEVGEVNPVFMIVPPGVVHGYRNLGDTDALVINVPDTLYAGWGRTSPVDEIRHEQDPNSEFRF